jgi:hypothetical protein
VARRSAGGAGFTAPATDEKQTDRSFRWPLCVYLGTALSLSAVMWFANAYLPDSSQGGNVPATVFDAIFGGWMHYDGGWYTSIADNGYWYEPGQQSAVAFFPAYPLAVRLLTSVTGSLATAGTVVTVLAGVGIAMLWWSWLAARVASSTQRVAFCVLMLWPYAWYLYGAVYADALFLVAALAAFVLLERDRPLLAGVAAAVATAARPVGIAVVAGLVVLVIERRRAEVNADAEGREVEPWSWLRRLRVRDAGVLVGLAGLGAWAAYLWLEFGDPLAFIAAQSGWQQDQGPATWLKLNFLDMVSEGRMYVLRLIPQAAAALACLLLSPRVGRRFGWGYGVYTFFVVAIPVVGSSNFQGLGRYVLAAFPVFALAGEWLAVRPALARVVIVVSAVGLVVGTALFGMGFYIA